LQSCGGVRFFIKNHPKSCARHFVRIPAAYTVWSVLGLLIFAGYTVVDFNRLRRAGKDEAIPLAASIFLDVFNIFLFFLQIFGGRS